MGGLHVWTTNSCVAMLTENVGGTEASFPVLLARVVTGMMTSARGAGGCAGEDAKKVA